MALAGCGGPPAGSAAADSSAAATWREKQAAANSVSPKPPAARTIDLRTLPQASQAKFAIYTADRLEGTARGTTADIFAHYRSALEKLGWKISSPPSKDQTADDSASALLQKGNDAIYLSVIPNVAGGGKPATDEKLVSLGNLGDCDSSKLPRLPGAEKGYGNRLSSSYFTDMKPAATAASVKNLLLHDGWQPYTEPYAIRSESPNFVRDEYRKQGNSLRVHVRSAAGDDKRPRSSVEYLIGAIGHQLPASRDAADVKFDDTLCQMQCSVPRDLQPVAKYYRDAMTDLGYEGPPEIPADETRVIMKFKSKDQEPLVLELTYDGRDTHVELKRG